MLQMIQLLSVINSKYVQVVNNSSVNLVHHLHHKIALILYNSLVYRLSVNKLCLPNKEVRDTYFTTLNQVKVRHITYCPTSFKWLLKYFAIFHYAIDDILNFKFNTIKH